MMTLRRNDAGEVLTQERLREVLSYDPIAGGFRWKDRGEEVAESISQSKLKEALDYDPVTGVFRWKEKPSKKILIGSEAGTVKRIGNKLYRYIRLEGRSYLGHRLAWFWVKGVWPSLIKFNNGDGLDCSIGNLREVDGGEPGNKDGKYWYIRIDGVDYLAQRLAWFWVNGAWPEFVRFNDGNARNCAISNLRDAAFVRAPGSRHDWRTKEGRKAQRREYYDKVRDRVRGQAFHAKFGIGLDEYRRLEQEQGGLCAICGNPETIKRNGTVRWLAIDHCHDSKRVRGLLCGSCNPMIGYAKDRIEVLERAIAYLKRHGA